MSYIKSRRIDIGVMRENSERTGSELEKPMLDPQTKKEADKLNG